MSYTIQFNTCQLRVVLSLLVPGGSVSLGSGWFCLCRLRVVLSLCRLWVVLSLSVPGGSVSLGSGWFCLCRLRPLSGEALVDDGVDCPLSCMSARLPRHPQWGPRGPPATPILAPFKILMLVIMNFSIFFFLKHCITILLVLITEFGGL